MTMAASCVPKLWDMFISSETYKKYSQYSQPEDRLHQAMIDWGLDSTVHADMMNGFNRFVGCLADYFGTNVSLLQVLHDLQHGYPVVMSGTFPGYPVRMTAPYGHIVCVVGAEWSSEVLPCGVPDYWIVDDPFGNTMDNWKGSGDDIAIPHALFNDWIKACGADSKWAHRFAI